LGDGTVIAGRMAGSGGHAAVFLLLLIFFGYRRLLRETKAAILSLEVQELDALINHGQNSIYALPALFLAPLVGICRAQAFYLLLELPENREVLRKYLARGAEGRHDKSVPLIHPEVTMGERGSLVHVFVGVECFLGHALVLSLVADAKVRDAALDGFIIACIFALVQDG